MLGIPVRYLLRHPASGAAFLAADPLEACETIRDSYAAQREQRKPSCLYEADWDWEEQLHRCLGVRGQCQFASEFWELWAQVIGELEAKGIRAGPESFGCWNDGDAGLVRSIWCLVRHRKPQQIIETGVAHGVTSRFILEALKRNGSGHLWSIDLPPMEKSRQEQVGLAVGDGWSDRWSLVKGSSRRRLPGLLAQLGYVDLFVHDSMHSERNVRFELDHAWAVLASSGAVVVDDVDANWGLRSFLSEFPGHPCLIGEAEPLRPDLRRFNKKGLFAIILKEAAARALSANA